MSLRDALANLARTVASQTTRNNTNVRNSQNDQMVQPLAVIISINTSAKTAIVEYPDKTTETVQLGGTNPLGTGTVVRISGGKII